VPEGVGDIEAVFTVNGRCVDFCIARRAPYIDFLGTPDTEGGHVTLRGSNLGNTVALTQQMIVCHLDKKPIRILRVFEPHKCLLLDVPPGTGSHSVELLVGNKASNSYACVYSQPNVHAVRQVLEHSETDSLQQILYVSGSNFGENEDKVMITVKGIRCKATVSIPHSKLRVELPSFDQPCTLSDIEVSVDGLRWTK
jgi:hypothetical protein